MGIFYIIQRYQKSYNTFTSRMARFPIRRTRMCGEGIKPICHSFLCPFGIITYRQGRAILNKNAQAVSNPALDFSRQITAVMKL